MLRILIDVRQVDSEVRQRTLVGDGDTRILQALYNIAKVAREDFLPFFPEVFNALFKLCADAERNVQNAAQFLDNLIKVFLTACST